MIVFLYTKQTEKETKETIPLMILSKGINLPKEVAIKDLGKL